MAPPQRYTFISDATDEFPNNKNNSFKMRLPNQLHLRGDNWYASLWSISVPNETGYTSLTHITNDRDVVYFGYTTYTLDNYQSGASEYARLTPARFRAYVHTTDVISTNKPVRTGVEFWQNVWDRMNFIMQDRLSRNLGANYNPPIRHALYEEWKPRIIMKDNAFVLPAVSSSSVADTGGTTRSSFEIKTDIAIKFGFLNKEKTGLGPNVKAEFATYDEQGGAIRSSVLGTYPVKGKTQQALLTRDADSSNPKVDWWTYFQQSEFVYFSRALQWTFFNLNESFEALMNTKDSVEQVMVYSDLVQSSVVGTGRYPLLREVTLNRTTKKRVSIEPRHREWIPVRSKTIDMVEIELATPSGPLTKVSDGKTIVTVGLQQL